MSSIELQYLCFDFLLLYGMFLHTYFDLVDNEFFVDSLSFRRLLHQSSDVVWPQYYINDAHTTTATLVVAVVVCAFFLQYNNSHM
jgi:hypothetical protein